MACRQRTYLDLIPIDGPGLALGVKLQPFVLGEAVIAPGTAKGPVSLKLSGELGLDAETGILFSLEDYGGDEPVIERHGDLAKEIFGSRILRRITGPAEVEFFYYPSDVPADADALAACFASSDAAAASKLADTIRYDERLILPISALRAALVRGVQKVGRRNARILARKGADASYPMGRPPLTAPLEEAWTLERLFGRPTVCTVRASKSA